MSLVNLTINKMEVSVPEGTTILDAAKSVNIKIPTLCHIDLKKLGFSNSCASCRICIVETSRGLVTSCATLVSEGLKVTTNSKTVLDTRRRILALILSDHPQNCLTCERGGDCELQQLAEELVIRRLPYTGKVTEEEIDNSSTAISKLYNKCIMCRRCEVMCNDVQQVGAISAINRGFGAKIGTFFEDDIADTSCTNCGQCINVCPTGAITEKNYIGDALNALNEQGKTCVVQVAPAVRVAIGEEFGLPAGSVSTGKLVKALRMLGFKYVFDTNFGADLTIMEEANEFVSRFNQNKKLPILTSCCPAWVSYVEHYYPKYIDLLSSCKSPQGMLGSIIKNYFSKKIGVAPEDMRVISIMPCVAKKYEISRDEFNYKGIKDNDVVITTRALAKILKGEGIDFNNLEEDTFDNPLGESSGAGNIFGTSGGVLEAALRTAYEQMTQKQLENLDFFNIRGLESIKESKIEIDGREVNVCAASSLGSAKKIMDEIVAGNSKYDVVEVMACPGGCIDGGGQPYHGGCYERVLSRSQSLYEIDKNKAVRKSHENESIKELYDKFLEGPGSHKAHNYLHTHYKDKSNIYKS